eukprot:350479_1
MQLLFRFILVVISIHYVQSATRLTTKGSKIYFPNGSEAILTGFNMLWDQSISITPSDPALAKSYLPGINVARLVMVHWDDGKRNDPIHNQPYPDCKTNNQSNGYLSDYCLNAFDERIKWMQQNNIWSVVTLRGQNAAGGNYPAESDIFHNSTLKAEFISMWQFLAKRYKDTDQIAAFEIMSEPRSTIIPLSQIASMYQETCTAIQNIDPDMICMIGPAPYYHLCNLNETMLIKNENVIYNFNAFIPKAYITVTTNYSVNWPGKMRCCDITLSCLPGWCPKNDCNTYVDLNKDWLRQSVNVVITNFRDKFNKPVFVDQW